MGLRPSHKPQVPPAFRSSSPEFASEPASTLPRPGHGTHTAHRRGIRVSSSKVVLHTKVVLSKQARRLARKADEHEQLIMKITYSLTVLGFGFFCYMLGARPHDIPLLYVAFFVVAAPLRWVYYRAKKWHYFLLDFCYYANLICTFYLLFFSKSERLFMLCFAFSEGPLAWALLVWRCSLVFSSLDKIVGVLIHLLPGTVIFIIRWWDPVTFSPHPTPWEDGPLGPWPAWPQVDGWGTVWTWLFVVPLGVYALWQLLYLAVVHGLRRQRILNDPEVLTSFRELARKASKANNFWWRLSGALGEERRFLMYALIQALFTVLTMALTVPMFRSYRLHAAFQFFKFFISIWNGGNFFFDVMPRQLHAKATARKLSEQQQHRGTGAHSPLDAAGNSKSAVECSSVPEAPEPEHSTEQCGVVLGTGSEALLLPARPGSEAVEGHREEQTGDRAFAPEGVPLGGEKDTGRPCRSCGRCSPTSTALSTPAEAVEEEADAFFLASTEPLWSEAVPDQDSKLANALGLRFRSAAGLHQSGQAPSETERNIWQGATGSVACVG